MSLEKTIRDTVIAESHDLDGRLQQLVRAGLMPANTIPILRKAIVKVQGGMTLQGAERDVMANFINSMMFIVLGDDAIFNRARAGAKTYATEAKEKTEYDYEGDMAMGQLKSIIANSQRMHDMLSDDTNLPEWVQSKITLAEDYISTASNYMQGEMSEETINEYAALAGVAGRMIASKLAKNAGAGVATRAIAGAAGSAAASSAVKKFSSTKETNEETIEEKRGLWDNIHAKRKRIKGGSGERMRKPGSEGAPTAAALKASQTEEVDLEEATYFVHTANNAHHVNEKIPTGKKDAMGQALMTSKVVKSFPYGDTQSKQTSPDQHKAAHAHAKKLNAGMKEEIDPDLEAELKATRVTKKSMEDSKKTRERASGVKEEADYSEKGDAERIRKRQEGWQKTFDAEKAMQKKAAAIKHANEFLKRYNKEEVESIDELSNKTLINYKDKAWREIRDADDNDDDRHYNKRMKGYKSALRADQRNFQRIHGNLVNGKFTKEEVENIDEISKDAALKYLSANKKDDVKARETGDYDRMTKRMRGTDIAVRKYTAKPGSKYVRVPATEEVEQVDEISKATAGRYINKAKDSIDTTSWRQGYREAGVGSPSGRFEKKLSKRHKGISMAVKKLTKEDIDAVKSMNETYKNTFDAALEHYNIKSPSELGEEKRKEFFNHVDQEFKKGDN
jgi:hypothetical protein